MINRISLRQLSSLDEAELLNKEFAAHFPWYRQGEYYIRCLEENRAGKRITLIAFYGDEVAGCCHLIYESKYPYFAERKIPEVNDLSVFEEYRRKGIASELLGELERIASETFRTIGLGVGLYKDYGNAQRLYGKRGYVMDGNGLTCNNVEVQPGTDVFVDDELLIYMVKELAK
ncbi:ribosomal protein S18 acetylase RimI-like enzyme [Paenibacillus sp. BK033]|uniref:GNAT family N-acetyltransferase n=1 Tax=Paenibacillus sp. BK033 TaxID=2512133 RepID=UPI00104846B3|nr:GNAT family N-acetyltransferase [Paenibacillus sp. BK033]TCN01357.1 ribosomal protein S18 acetylase RimI-like enzyme [Paenibacillus sp. BK033]